MKIHEIPQTALGCRGSGGLDKGQGLCASGMSPLFFCTGTVFGEGQVRGAQLKHPVAPKYAEKHYVFAPFSLQTHPWASRGLPAP